MKFSHITLAALLTATFALNTAKAQEDPTSWKIVYTAPNYEKRFAALVHEILPSAETHIPEILELRPWSDRTKTISVPLFKRKVFVRGSEADLVKMKTLPGFVKFETTENALTTFSNASLSMIQLLSYHNKIKRTLPISHLQGDEYCLTGGPLKGIIATEESVRGGAHYAIAFPVLKEAILIDYPQEHTAILDSEDGAICRR